MTTDRRQDLPLVLVIGATGAQGGSVARHLLAGGRFRVRALTRRPQGDEARTLAALGAEVVAGDLDDRASLRAAMRGAHGLFGVTDWWEHFDREEAHGRALVDIAAAMDVRHLVLSTQPSAAAGTQGRVTAAPFESKAAVERYARALGVPATFVHVSFHWENLLSLFVPRRLPDGTFHLGLPLAGKRLAGIGVDDIGGAVARILAAGAAVTGRAYPLVGEANTAEEIAAALARATRRPVRAAEAPESAPWARVPGAEAIGRALDETFAAYRAMQDGLDDAMVVTRELFAPTSGLAAWVEAHRAELEWTFARMSRRVSRGA